ncbi:hypothetical protein PoB_000253700 [Plakobranchus ocellatus]|uniref:Uncharacterized protein n=1 Tax=Plakobranchus ocellatus TaxID=259542 RepID=A0AAV3Y0S7_9GAST|nr:hypothetical protein PoB_000253700 [Plakobranchus ocellatus]
MRYEDYQASLQAAVVFSYYNLCARKPVQSDLRFSDLPSGQNAGGGVRTGDRRIPADFRADLLSIVPSTPRRIEGE